MRSTSFVLATMLLGACGGRVGPHMYPSDQHPDAGEATKTRVEGNIAQFAPGGFACLAPTKLLSGPPTDNGIVLTGDAIPGGFSLNCHTDAPPTYMTYRVLFRPTSNPADVGHDRMSIECYASLESPRCPELIASLLK